MEPTWAVELGNDEHKVLKVFDRYGRDGRAITTASLAVHAGLPQHSTQLRMALVSLVRRGVLQEAGSDPLLGDSPAAYRLSRALRDAPADAFGASARDRAA